MLVQTPRDVFLRTADPFMPCRTIATQFQALCTSLHGVLFSFRSPYYCAIGLKSYLVLEVDDSQIPAGFPTHGTQDTNPSRLITPTGLSPSMACFSKQFRLLRLCVVDSAYDTTSPLARIRFELCRFRSPLFTASLTISFPALTKMFQSRAFPIPGGINQLVRSSH